MGILGRCSLSFKSLIKTLGGIIFIDDRELGMILKRRQNSWTLLTGNRKFFPRYDKYLFCGKEYRAK
jgi:hypothetical protein